MYPFKNKIKSKISINRRYEQNTKNEQVPTSLLTLPPILNKQ